MSHGSFFLVESSVAIFAELRAPGSCTDRSSGGGKPLIPGSGKKPPNDWTLVFLGMFFGVQIPPTPRCLEAQGEQKLGNPIGFFGGIYGRFYLFQVCKMCAIFHQKKNNIPGYDDPI